MSHGLTVVGVATQCAPSENPRSTRDITYLDEWLRRGFAIVATDYQGLGSPGVHPYLNTRAEAYGVLDGVRAALGALPNLRNKVLIVGQSQGGGGAFAAAGWAPRYAPELRVIGTVATGIPYPGAKLPAGVPSVVPQPDPVMSYILLIAVSQAGINPAFRPSDVLAPAAMPYFEMARHACLAALEPAVNKAGLTRANGLRPGAVQALAAFGRSMLYPTLKIEAPVFIGYGGKGR